MSKINYSTSGKSVEFEEGVETNLLSTSIRYQGEIPYRCGGGLCGTCRVHVDEGAENLTKIRKNEIERLGDDINKGYRLACMCFATGDVRLSWDPNRNVKVPSKVKAYWESKIEAKS
jgi:ferredoxin